MQCIYCNYDITKVTDTGKTKKTVLRKRACMCCGKEFYTEERADITKQMVHRSNLLAARLAKRRCS